MTRLIAILAALGLTATATFAQSTATVRFQAGSDNAAVNGSVIGDGYFDYVLGAAKGQTMAVALSVTGTNGNGTAYFNILPPGSDGAAIYNGSMDDDNFASITLPENGDYTVRVYLMGNDRDTGKTVGYTLSFTIQ